MGLHQEEVKDNLHRHVHFHLVTIFWLPFVENVHFHLITIFWLPFVEVQDYHEHPHQDHHFLDHLPDHSETVLHLHQDHSVADLHLHQDHPETDLLHHHHHHIQQHHQ